MQATFELKKSSDRVAIAGLAMLATLIVRCRCTSPAASAVRPPPRNATISRPAPSMPSARPLPPAQLIAPAAAVSTVGVASPATNPGSAARAFRLELQDQRAQAGSVAPAARASHSARRTQQ